MNTYMEDRMGVPVMMWSLYLILETKTRNVRSQITNFAESVFNGMYFIVLTLKEVGFLTKK